MSEDWVGWGSPLGDISDDLAPTKSGPMCLDVANIGYGIGYMDQGAEAAMVAQAIRRFEESEVEQEAAWDFTVLQIEPKVRRYRKPTRTGSWNEAFLDSFVRVL